MSPKGKSGQSNPLLLNDLTDKPKSSFDHQRDHCPLYLSYTRTHELVAMHMGDAIHSPKVCTVFSHYSTDLQIVVM